MAIIRYPETGITIEARDQITDMLRLIGVRFEIWGVQRLPSHLRGRHLDDAEKAQVMEVFKEEVTRLKDQGGYRYIDVLTLYPDTPQIDELMTRFDRRHKHAEHEIRFCIQGSGIFHLLPPGGQAVDIEMHPGDFISLPAGIPHYFTLTAERRFAVIRCFQREDGWVAEYF